jgi:hypothetical protein
MRFISPKVHGIIDYLVVVFLLASPMYFGFTGLLATFTYALAFVHFLLTVFTNYPPGIFKVVPFPFHGAIELLVGVILLSLAYTLFADKPDGQLFYVIFGTYLLLTWLVTDYKGINAEKAVAKNAA